MSPLVATTVRGLVTAQVTTILAKSGQARWCELTTADPTAVQPFLEIFPQALFACVHRGCLGMIRAATAASPWGLYGEGFAPYMLSYPGNNVAALAAYWATYTAELLAFEEANPKVSRRVRYEDATAEPSQVLPALTKWLCLRDSRHELAPPGQSHLTEPVDITLSPSEREVPVGMIPEPLRQHINRLHAELGYPPLPG
jgi:hypothetical protein